MSGDLRYQLYAEDALLKGDVSWFLLLLREGAPMPASTMKWLADVLDPDVRTEVSLEVKFRPGPRPDPEKEIRQYRLGEEVHGRAADDVGLEPVLVEMEAEGRGSRSTLLEALRLYRTIHAQESGD